MKKFFQWTVIVLGGPFLIIVLAGLILYPMGLKKLNKTYPNTAVEAVHIPSDEDAVARGRHIATIWVCTRCHGEDLSGRVITKDPLSGLVPLFGTISSANLTSGQGGIAASYTDSDWVRAIRHAILPDGQVEVLMFNYSTMNDQDLSDLIAYLKHLPPVNSDLPEMRYGPIVPVVSNLGLLTPAAERIDHETSRQTGPTPAASAEYGGYLSTICTACHGSGIGTVVGKWNEEQFVRTFKTGILADGKEFGPTMSSDTFREMTDIELTALWLYFTSGKK